MSARTNSSKSVVPVSVRQAAPARPAVAAAPADPLIAGFSKSTVASVSDAVDQVVGRRGYLTHDMRPYVAGAFVGRASDKFNGKYLVMIGLAGLAAGLAVFAWQATVTTNPWALVPALLVCGVGIGFIFAPMSNVTMGSVEPRLAGTASGIFNTARQVGGVIGSAAIGVLLQARISAAMADHESPQAALTTAAKETFILPIAVLLLGIFAALAMRKTAPRAAPVEVTA